MKTLVYPFDAQFETILEFSEMLSDIEIVSCVSLKCFGMLNDEYYQGNKILCVCEEFEKEIEKCELVWFIDSEIPVDFEKNIVPKLKCAVQEQKKILITRNMTEEERKKVIEIVPPDSRYQMEEEIVEDELSKKRIYNIKTPIVTVCSLYNGLQQFYLELSLNKELSRRGVKVLQIGSEKSSFIFGIESIPEYMYGTTISEIEKIKRFNHFLKQKELEKNYDVIVLGIPGELLGLKENVFSELGIYAFEMLRTISSDCTVLCLPCEENITKNKGELAKAISQNFGLPIDYFNIAPVKIDLEDSEEENKISYVKLGNEMLIDKKCDDIFCVKLNGEIERLAESIMRQLTFYGSNKTF